MIKRHAVLLTVLFALIVSLMSLSTIFWEFYKLNKEQYINHIFTKYSVITQIYREHQQRQSSEIMLEANFAVYNLEITKDKKNKKQIFEKGKILKREGFKSFNTSLLINNKGLYTKNVVTNLRATMIEYKRNIYFHIETPSGDILIEDNELRPYSYINLLYSYITIFMIISLSFILILQRLRPLIRLRKKIEFYGNGNMDISFKTNLDDEIGAVANELEHARQKINNILESRTLFLRNLMHELKTPIAKGTIATQMLDSQKQRDRFSSIFKRLESLVTEFAMIEEVTSLDDKKDFSEYRLLDVIDGAIDMAMIDKEHVTVKISGKIKLHVNYRLYITAIKNMIDNAIKYSDDKKVVITAREGKLLFENYGKGLDEPLEHYLEPFTKSHKAVQSFGLGLYIVYAILDSHNYKLKYEHINGWNRFWFELS